MPARTINDLPKGQSLANVRFRYPGDGQLYYWTSHWAKGVWGRKDLSSERIFPLLCEDIEEALTWEVV
jgi:hypothetical protein